MSRRVYTPRARPNKGANIRLGLCQLEEHHDQPLGRFLLRKYVGPDTVEMNDDSALGAVVPTAQRGMDGCGAVAGRIVHYRDFVTSARLCTWGRDTAAADRLLSVTIEPIDAVVYFPATRTVQYRAIAHYRLSGDADITTQGTWASSDQSTAVISATNGLATIVPLATATINSFSAYPATMFGGDTSTLNWSTVSASSLSIDNGVGTVTGTSWLVNPATTTNYTLTAYGAYGSVVTAGTTVTVNVPSILSFGANASSVDPGSTASLSWSVTGATGLTLGPGIGTVTGTQWYVTPSVSTVYALTATNPAGSVTATKTIGINLPVISSFSSNKSTMFGGDTASLSWTVASASSLSIGGIGAVTGTSWLVYPTTGQDFYLTATNAGGSTYSSLVHINVAAPSLSAFAIDRSSMFGGDTASITWTVTGALATSINTIGAVTGNQWYVHPIATQVYELTASNPTGIAYSTPSTLTVNVPTISSFTATPSTVVVGSTASLSWSVTGAVSLSINQGIGVVTGTQWYTPALTASVTYTLSAINPAGTGTATVNISGATLPALRAFYTFNEATGNLYYNSAPTGTNLILSGSNAYGNMPVRIASGVFGGGTQSLSFRGAVSGNLSSNVVGSNSDTRLDDVLNGDFTVEWACVGPAQYAFNFPAIWQLNQGGRSVQLYYDEGAATNVRCTWGDTYGNHDAQIGGFTPNTWYRYVYTRQYNGSSLTMSLWTRTSDANSWSQYTFFTSSVPPTSTSANASLSVGGPTAIPSIPVGDSNRTHCLPAQSCFDYIRILSGALTVTSTFFSGAA